MQQHSNFDLLVLGNPAADGAGGTGGEAKTLRCHHRWKSLRHFVHHNVMGVITWKQRKTADPLGQG